MLLNNFWEHPITSWERLQYLISQDKQLLCTENKVISRFNYCRWFLSWLSKVRFQNTLKTSPQMVLSERIFKINNIFSQIHFTASFIMNTIICICRSCLVMVLFVLVLFEGILLFKQIAFRPLFWGWLSRYCDLIFNGNKSTYVFF